MNSQSIKGIIYEDASTAKGVLIQNINKNLKTYSDSEGFFEISANMNDTIVFGSLFHETKTIILKRNHFSETIVIELKKVVNKLSEVLVSNEPVVKEFEEKAYSENIQNQIKRDIELRPYLYSPAPSGNFDFIAIAGMIAKLFKSKKNKKKKEVYQPITYNDIKILFETGTFFNKDLLHNQLKIPIELKYLFFEYCEAQQLNKELLKEDDHFLLLNELIKCSNDFLKNVQEFTKD